MILILTYLCCAVEPDLFQQATENIDAYYDTCVMIADNPEDC
jgi:hypothetical protein